MKIRRGRAVCTYTKRRMSDNEFGVRRFFMPFSQPVTKTGLVWLITRVTDGKPVKSDKFGLERRS